MRGLLLPVALLTCGVYLFAGFSANAQDHEPMDPVSSTYAIKNVTIVQEPGRIIDRGLIIIKNGLIDAVGADLAIPPQAIIVDADSLYAYAAFIDGLSHTGVGKEAPEIHDRIEDPGNPPPAQAGINPQNDVRDYLVPDDRSVKDLRCAGFGASQVVPKGIFLPGAAAIILLGGATPDEMVIQPKSACYSELTPNKTVYPSTVMALTAKWRELYQQAINARNYGEAYASGSRGLPRPTSSRILESFYPVIAKRQPVLFKAGDVLDIQRILALQGELDFTLVLGDVREGWDLTDKIRKSGAKVFLALDLPEDPEEKDQPDNEQKDDEKHAAQKDTLTDPEIEALKARRSAFIGKMVAQAAAFDSAGIKFGFSALNTKYSAIHKNLHRMLEAGLKPESALAALTVHAAELLGVDDRLGTIDKGKIANIVLFDKPMNDKEARITMIFVDGKPYPCDGKKAHKKPGVAIEGAWSFTAQAPQENIELDVVFKKSDQNHLSGVVSGNKLPKTIELNNVVVKDKTLTFSYDVLYEGKSYNVTVEGKLEGEAFNGDMHVGAFGTFPVRGAKKPKS